MSNELAGMEKCERRRFKSVLPVCISCALLQTVKGDEGGIDADARVALCVAAARADAMALRRLLRGEVDLNAREPFFEAPPFFYAVDAAIHRRPDSHEVLELLAMRGADLDCEVQDVEAVSFGLTPLRLAVWDEEPTLIRKLIWLGADVEEGRAEGRDTPLFFTLNRGVVVRGVDQFDNWLPDPPFHDAIGPQAEALIACGARTRELIDGGPDFRQLLQCHLVDGATDIAWCTQSERYGQSDNMGLLLSIYQRVADAVQRRREVDVLQACNNAYRRKHGRWLLPSEIVREVATFLGVLLLPLRGARKK